MLNMPEALLAKSKPRLTLEQHLLDAESATSMIFRLDGRWGKNWCRFFRIEEETEQQRFLLNLQVAALFHDIGKANADFYLAVTKPGFQAQTLRHEHLSALILCLPAVRKWLSHNQDLDIDVITAAVLSHHLKASEDDVAVQNNPEATERYKSYKWCKVSTAAQSVQLYLQHPEVTATLGKIAKVAKLQGIPDLPSVNWQAKTIWEEVYKKGKQSGQYFKREISKNSTRQRFLAAVKAGLIVSDSAASGLVRTGHSIDLWIEDVVHSESIAASDIASAILTPRAKQIEAKTKIPFVAHSFQIQMAQQSARSLLLAACGAGKTLGAWMWAEAQAKHYKIGKVIFLYPTRGTAAEGFRDYVGWAPETEAALMTGTARYELNAMRENPNDSIKDKDFQADERLYSLGFWSRRYFSATVDQFLGFMEHSYPGLCLLPVLADSAVIIDEVHSFDRRMFNTLISFLKNFDIPVLCMTATLPTGRKQQLIDAGLQVFPTEDDREQLADLKEKEEHPRYDLEPVENFKAAFDKAIMAYRAGERVLWVVNTVDRCIAIAERLEDKLKVPVLTYHSRFRLKDRQKVHKNTVDAFAYEKEQKDRKPAIAVTTQVCEMSLDLDADVLITELAPVPSLVQRFGRSNRHLARGYEFRAKIHTYSPPPKSIKPYSKEELDIARQFIGELSAQSISQYQLAEALEKYSQQEPNADGSARFLDSGYYATPGSFRATDDFSVPCILDCDIEAIKAIWDSPEKYLKEGYMINVPKKFAQWETEDHSWLSKYIGIAPSAGHYDNPSRGFTTKQSEEVDLG
jgi:CRISPR-associated endonuclease/helicase Cas3